jgi:FkbM family methyltransferase
MPSPLAFIREVRRMGWFMPPRDAWHFCRSKDRREMLSVNANGYGVVHLRGGTSDIRCFEKIFIHGEYHCPFEIQPKLIVDAGANTGLSARYFAHSYPDAKIIAIEPEPENFALLRKNCAAFQTIVPIEGALWPRSGNVKLAGTFDGEPWAFHVSAGTEGPIRGYTIEDILRITSSDCIDLLKIDIEGSERELFDAGAPAWLDHVSIIVIEFHDRVVPGCSKAFYSALSGRNFHQEVGGENVFVKIL